MEETSKEQSVEEQEEQQEQQEDAAARTAVVSPTDYVSTEEMELADCWQGSKEDALAKVMHPLQRKKLRRHLFFMVGRIVSGNRIHVY